MNAITSGLLIVAAFATGAAVALRDKVAGAVAIAAIAATVLVAIVT